MIFRPDTSFPFLALARKHRVDYSYVLWVSDVIDCRFLADEPIDRNLGLDVYYAMRREDQRRATVAHNALHNGDAP